MYLGEKSYGLNLESVKQKFMEQSENEQQCEFELSELNMEEVDDFARVSPSNMFLPIMAFVACAFTAIIMQLVHENKRRKGRASSLGRKSTLDLFDVVRKNRSARDEKFDDNDWVMPRAKAMVKRRMSLDNSEVDRDAKSAQFSDFPGANIPGDEFNENGAPQSTHGPTSIFRGSMDDIAMANGGADEAVDEGNEITHRIEELVESGVIEEVLDCFDFFQEMKKLKKVQ
jgi:hypothetical protein